jgi:YD repeat-containing protein
MMPDNDQQEKVLEKEGGDTASTHGPDSAEVQSALQERSYQYKAEIEQRKKDYDAGVRRISSSYSLLKDMPVTICDGEKKLLDPGSTAKQTAADAGNAHQNPDGSAMSTDSKGRIVQTTDVNGNTRSFGYDSHGKLNEMKDGAFRWTTTDGKHWRNDQGEEIVGNADVTPDGSFKFQNDGYAMVSHLDGTTERIARDNSAIVEDTDGKIVQTKDATGKTRAFQYDAEGNLNGVTEADGSKWSTADGETWATPEGKAWKGTIALGNDGTYSYIDDNAKETINKQDGTITVKEPTGLITDTLPDGSVKVVQEAPDRERLSRLAERLHGDDAGLLTQNEIALEQNRKKLGRSGKTNDLLNDLTPAEREALKGIYHQKYGHTIDSDYTFLEEKDKRDFDKLFEKTDDPIQAKADRLRAAMDKSYDDYSWYSYSHTDRKNNANDEVRSTLESMNSDEIKQMDNYYKRVYGVSLQEAINKDTPSATRELCAVYLKGSDKRTADDDKKALELQLEEKRKVEGTPDPKLTSAELEQVFDDNFDRLDRDKDGFVSQGEIDHAMKDPDYKGKDAQLLVVLKGNREELEELSDDENFDENDGVTRKDMAKLAELAKKEDKTPDEQKLVKEIDISLNDSGRKLQALNKAGGKNLWGKNSEPLDSIHPEAIDQESLGDCYFVAPVAGMANTPEGKQQIKDMIEDNGDGTYRVTFPGDPDHPVTVDEPTQAELARGSKPGKDGIWVAVLEKAYGKYQSKHSEEEHEYSIDHISNGGSNKTSLQLLTGKEVDQDFLSDTTKETTHEKLTAAIHEKRPVTAGTREEWGQERGWSDGYSDGAGVPMHHAYTVTDYNPETRMVTLRNPWKEGDPKFRARKLDDPDDGTFQMSLDDFHKEFQHVEYTQRS